MHVGSTADRTYWRISNYRSLSGEGGLLYPARWHTRGHAVVYLAESPAGAMLETLVHMELRGMELPPTYNLLRVNVPADLQIESLIVPEIDRWKNHSGITQAVGDEWLESKRSSLARVPSAILPHTWNCLLNSLHPDAGKARIAESTIAEFDPRLLRKVYR
jgi:RES domain-containing protein